MTNGAGRHIPHIPITTYNLEILKNPDKFIWVSSTIIVSEHSDMVLCQKRRKTGEWEFPGGKLEKGENYRACAVREVKEELGIEVEIEEYVCSAILGRLESMFAVQFYLATMSDPTQEIELDPYAVEEVKWCRLPSAVYLGDWLPATTMAWGDIQAAVQKFTTERFLAQTEDADDE